METKTENTLNGYTDQEKGAYLGALASLATADHSASQEELDHLRELARAAGLSPQQEGAVLQSATELSQEELKKCLDVLKSSNLRYALITDLIALAKADDTYSEEEKENIEKMAQYLQVNKTQFSLLDQFVNKAAASNASTEEISKPSFIQSLGMQDQFSRAGFNLGPTGRSLIGFLGPMLLGGMAARALGGSRRGVGMGGALGGLLGNGMAMGGGMGMPGGLGSLISGLNRGRSNRSVGGLLSQLFR